MSSLHTHIQYILIRSKLHFPWVQSVMSKYTWKLAWPLEQPTISNVPGENTLFFTRAFNWQTPMRRKDIMSFLKVYGGILPDLILCSSVQIRITTSLSLQKSLCLEGTKYGSPIQLFLTIFYFSSQCSLNHASRKYNLNPLRAEHYAAIHSLLCQLWVSGLITFHCTCIC